MFDRFIQHLSDSIDLGVAAVVVVLVFICIGGLYVRRHGNKV